MISAWVRVPWNWPGDKFFKPSRVRLNVLGFVINNKVLNFHSFIIYHECKNSKKKINWCISSKLQSCECTSHGYASNNFLWTLWTLNYVDFILLSSIIDVYIYIYIIYIYIYVCIIHAVFKLLSVAVQASVGFDCNATTL